MQLAGIVGKIEVLYFISGFYIKYADVVVTVQGADYIIAAGHRGVKTAYAVYKPNRGIA